MNELAPKPDDQERDHDDREVFYDAVDTDLNEDERSLLLPQDNSLPAPTTSQTPDAPLITPSPPLVTSKDEGTQTEFTAYPDFVNDTIKKEVVQLQRIISALPGRLRMARCHAEVGREIDFIADKIRLYINNHRNQITRYCQAVVLEGHRHAVRDELRKSSNECLMPLLDITDRLKNLNDRLATGRGPLNVYRPLVDELLECRGLIQMIIHIVPQKLLI
jgi:hypothetical protein